MDVIILNTTLAGYIDRKIEAITSFIYIIRIDIFGADEKEVMRRESKMAKMRKDLRELRYKKEEKG